MTSDTELNEKVAMALGWKSPIGRAKFKGKNVGIPFKYIFWTRGDFHKSSPPDYSTSIEVAWEIIEHLRGNGFGVTIEDEGDEWCCRFENDEEWFEAADKPVAKAISMAFLQIYAVGDKKYKDT